MSDFQFPPIDHYANPKGAEDAVIDRCIEAQFEGLAITAPARVNLNTREGLAVVGCWAASLRDAKLLPFDDTVIATAVCLESGTPYVALAVEPPEVAEPYEPSDSDPGDGTTYQMFLLELRRRLGLPWKPGTYLITLLQRDRRSNRVKSELCQSATYDDPEVRRLREELFRKQPPRHIYPEPAVQPEPEEGQPAPAVVLPTFQKLETSPDVPDAGVALAVERVVVTKPGARAVLSGSFSLPLLPNHVLSDERRAALEGTPAEGATGVVPLTIVLSGSERPKPIVLKLGVPTFDPIDRDAAEPRVTGQFTLDLLRVPAVAAMPSQTYFIHALAGETLTEASVLALVSPALLPGA